MKAIGCQLGQYVLRKGAEEARRESDEQYRNLAEAAPDAIITIDEAATITFCNHAAEQMFGYGKQELVGQELAVLIPPSLRQSHHLAFARYLHTQVKSMPWQCLEFPGLQRTENRSRWRYRS